MVGEAERTGRNHNVRKGGGWSQESWVHPIMNGQKQENGHIVFGEEINSPSAELPYIKITLQHWEREEGGAS